MSLESAQNWPTLAHLRVPVFASVVVGLVPIVVAIVAVFEFLRAVDRGDAFSTGAIRVLGRLKRLAGVFAGYFAVGLVVFWTVTGLMHPTLLFTWFLLEVAALFLVTAAALFERLFTEAFELRTENELTV